LDGIAINKSCVKKYTVFFVSIIVIKMFSQLFETKYNKLGFEDMQFATQHPDQFLIINTMAIHEQDCLIKHTIPPHLEEKLINDILSGLEMGRKKIIVYGKNTSDDTVERKYKQLVNLGFVDIYLYSGGMFEWILLQDIYGKDEFPTSSKVLDILKYKPLRTFGKYYLEYK